MDRSPIEQLLEAIDGLDLEQVVALTAPDGRLLMVDGRRAEGRDAVRELLAGFLSTLRSASHRITAQWHEGDVWIAEVEATYELRDYLRLNALPRSFIVKTGPEGITNLRVYGAHERPLTEHRTGEEGIWLGARWIPSL